MSYPDDSHYQLVLCTCPDEETANRLATLLVEQQHAACVNIVPGLTSVYRWKGKVEIDREHLLVIKTRADHYGAVESLIREQHPYELPEVIAVPIGNGLEGYLRWLDKELQWRS
jgi:periplasmic divalent cation tolerance protein